MICQRASCLFLSLFLAGASLVHAMPKGGHVKSGHATFSSLDNKGLEIVTSDTAVIHWDEFSVGAGELTRFVQPGRSSVVLNRVMGGNASEIFGTLEANGKLFLINPNGIFVGASGVVNVGAFVASTLDCLEGNALEGGDLLFSGTSRNKIVNLGRVSAWDGDVILMARSVLNEGALEAPFGTAAVGVGSEILLSHVGGERLFIRVGTAETDHEVGIDQAGSVQALQVELKSKGNPYALAIRHRGRVDALSTEERGGRVFLVAEEGKTEVSGEIFATNGAGQGGEVCILGDEVGVFETACIDVSGECGGGTVLLGGDFQGSNPYVLNANQTVVKEGARIVGDALGSGNGGRVFVWSRAATAFYGEVSVKGGLQGGDGGLVALLGDDHFDFRGRANRLAPQGKAGMLILDPTSLTIAECSDVNIPLVTPFHPLSTASSSFLCVATLLDALEGGDVIVQSAGGAGVESGDVTLNSELSFDSDYNLTLRSFVPGVTAGDVQINAPITNLGEGGLVLDSCRDINVSAPIEICGFDGIAMTGGRDIRISHPVKTGGNLTMSASEEIYVLAALEAEGGMALSSKRGIDVLADLWASGSGVSLNSGGEIALFSSVECVGQGGIRFSGEGNLNIGSEASNTPSTIHCDRGTINIVSTHGDVAIVGGKEKGAFVDICSSYGPITINATENGREIRLQGGTADGAYAKIRGERGSVSLWSGGEIVFHSGSGLHSDVAASVTTARGNIRLRAHDDVTIQGGSSGAFSNPARISSQQGSISVNAKNAHLLGGEGPGSSALIESGTRTISINVESLNLHGGSGAAESMARIHSDTGSININTANDLSLQGGDNTSCLALIASEKGRLVFNNIGGDLKLQGGGAESSTASLGDGDVEFYAIGGDVVLQGGSHPTAGVFLSAPSFPQEGILGSLRLDGGSASARIDGAGDLFLKVQGNAGIVARGDAGVSTDGALQVSSDHGVHLEDGYMRSQGNLEVNTNSLVMDGGVLESQGGTLLVNAKESCLLKKHSEVLADANIALSGEGPLTALGLIASKSGDVALKYDQGMVLEGTLRGGTLNATSFLNIALGAEASLEHAGVVLESGLDIAVNGGMQAIGLGGIAMTAGRDIILDTLLSTDGQLNAQAKGLLDVLGDAHARHRIFMKSAKTTLLGSLSSEGRGGVRVLSDGDLIVSSPKVFSPAGSISLVSTQGDVILDQGSVSTVSGPITLNAKETGRTVALRNASVHSDQGAVALWSGGDIAVQESSSVETALGPMRLTAHGECLLAGPAELRSSEGQISLTAQNTLLRAGSDDASSALIKGGDAGVIINTGRLALEGGSGVEAQARIHAGMGSIQINTTGDFSLIGGSSDLCRAEIVSDQGHVVFNTLGGDVLLQGGSHPTAVSQLLSSVFPDEGITGSLRLIGQAAKAHIGMDGGFSLLVKGDDGIVARGDAGVSSEGALHISADRGVLLENGYLCSCDALDVAARSLVMDGGVLESEGGTVRVITNESCHLGKQSEVLAHADIDLNGEGTLTALGLIASSNGDVTLRCSHDMVLDGKVASGTFLATSPLNIALGANASLICAGVVIESGLDITARGGMQAVGLDGIALTAGRDISLDTLVATLGHLAIEAKRALDVRGEANGHHHIFMNAAKTTVLGVVQSEGPGGIRIQSDKNLNISSPKVFTPAGSISLVSAHGDVILDQGSVSTMSGPITLNATEAGCALNLHEASIHSDQGAITLWSGGDIAVLTGSRVETRSGPIRLTAQGECLLAGPSELRSSEGQISLSAKDTYLIAGQGGAAQIEGGQVGVVLHTDGLMLEGGSGEGALARIHSGKGVITITTTGDLTLKGGSGPECTAQIASESGDVIFNSIGGDLTLQGGTHPLAHATIGQASGEGSILFTEVGILGALRLLGGEGRALIGQGNLLIKVRGQEGILAEGNAGLVSSRELHIRTTHGITLRNNAEFRAQGNCDISAHALVMDGGIIESAEGNLTLHLEEASFGTPEMTGCVQCAALQGNLLVKTDAFCALQGGAAENAFVELLGGNTTTVRSSGTLSLQGGTGEGADASIAAAFDDVVLNASSDITLQGTERSHAFVRQLGGGNGDLTVVGYGDVTLAQNAYFENLSEGELNTFADRDLSLSENAYFSHHGRGVLATAAGRDMLLSGTSSIHQNGTGNLFIVSGRNTVMGDTFSAHTTSGNLSVVVDHFLPGHPVIGDGSFIKTSAASLSSTSGLVSIYTARRGQNSVEGEINGQTVAFGTEYEDNENEQWLTFFSDDVKTALDFFWDDAEDLGLPIMLASAPSASKAPVYVIYYKDGKSKAVSWNSATISRTANIKTSSKRWEKALQTSNRITRAESAALQDFRTLAEFLFVPKRFLVSYDATSYFNCCELHNCCPAFNEMLDEYTLLRRKVRTYNTKKLGQRDPKTWESYL